MWDWKNSRDANESFQDQLPNRADSGTCPCSPYHQILRFHILRYLCSSRPLLPMGELATINDDVNLNTQHVEWFLFDEWNQNTKDIVLPLLCYVPISVEQIPCQNLIEKPAAVY